MLRFSMEIGDRRVGLVSFAIYGLKYPTSLLYDQQKAGKSDLSFFVFKATLIKKMIG